MTISQQHRGVDGMIANYVTVYPQRAQQFVDLLATKLDSQRAAIATFIDTEEQRPHSGKQLGAIVEEYQYTLGT